MHGKCLCGEIEFVAQEVAGLVFNCHCSRCRRSHGADYATQAFAARSSLQFLKGEELLKEYDSGGGLRTFCSNCGSRLMNYAKEGGDYLSVAIACLDESYQGQAIAHCFVNSKAPWHTPSADIESHEELPTSL